MTDAHRHFLTGQVLIAMPNMGDPRFERSLVLICSHREDHAMGVIVNRRLPDMAMGELVRQFDIEVAPTLDDQPVYYGGPVQQERGLVLHTLDYMSENTLVVADNLGITGTREILVDVAGAEPGAPPPDRFMLALGHAGWSAGQLEEEIQMNAWAHVEASERLVFGGGADDAWGDAFRTIGVTAAMFSREWSAPRDDDAPVH